VTLQKPVVFEGTYYPPLTPDQAPAADARLELKKRDAASEARSRRAQQQQSAAATTNQGQDDEEIASDARVIGRARVAGREVSVDASAVTP
jgi:hypothetical protein